MSPSDHVFWGRYAKVMETVNPVNQKRNSSTFKITGSGSFEKKRISLQVCYQLICPFWSGGLLGSSSRLLIKRFNELRELSWAELSQSYLRNLHFLLFCLHCIYLYPSDTPLLPQVSIVLTCLSWAKLASCDLTFSCSACTASSLFFLSACLISSIAPWSLRSPDSKSQQNKEIKSCKPYLHHCFCKHGNEASRLSMNEYNT